MEQNQDSVPNTACPCGLSKESCILRHTVIDRELEHLRNEDSVTRKIMREDIHESEIRLKDEISNQKSILQENIGHQNQISEMVSKGIRESYKAAVDKAVGGLNRQGRLMDSLVIRVDEIEDMMPTKAIERISNLETWRTWLTGIAVGIALISGVVHTILVGYYNRTIADIEAKMGRLKQVEQLYERMADESTAREKKNENKD